MSQTCRKVKNYTEDDMLNALAAVKNGEMSQYKAAKVYKIPKQTLNDRVTNKVSVTCKQGRPARLTTEEEKAIAEICATFAEWGMGLGKSQVLGIVADYLRANKKSHLFPKGIPGNDWWRSFLKRNPSISMRKPQSLQLARARNANIETVDHWFNNILKPLIDKTGLLNHPERIFNADETSFCLCGRPQKVVAKRGAKSPQYTVGGTGKENITVQVCVSAAGQLLPPYILYTGQRLMHTHTQDGAPGTRYAVSAKGWMTKANFVDWFRNMFIPYLPSERPVLLIIDGHESHVKYEVRDLAAKNGIELAKLPSHTTHLLQPLDVSVMKPLKENYDKAAHTLFVTQRQYIKKTDFPSLIAKTWKQFQPQHAINGFKKTGIVPFNRGAISDESLKPIPPVEN